MPTLEIGSFQSRTCQGMTRRALLSAGVAAPFALASSANARSSMVAEPGKARSILLVWLGGGPSHLDLFDPKPKAPVEYRGPFATIATRSPGVRYTELLPKLAARSHKFSLIRSNVNFHDGHREAGSIALTGHRPRLRSTRPILARSSPGSAATTHSPVSSRSLAARLAMASAPSRATVAESGAKHTTLSWSAAPSGQVELPSLKLADGLSPERLTDRRFLLAEIDRVRRDAESGGTYEVWDHLQKRAYALLTSPAGIAALDLSRESQATRSIWPHVLRPKLPAGPAAGGGRCPVCPGQLEPIC